MKFLSLLLAIGLAASAALADEHATFEVGGLTFKRPAAWEWVPVNSPMRKAQLKVAGEGGTAAEVTFFFFGESSGDVKSNADRWLKQFEAKAGVEKVETQSVGATKLTLVSTEGIYHSGMPGGPTTPLADYALQGAILESAGGNVFVKMTGPKPLVDKNRAAFVDFVKDAAAGAK